MEQGTSTNEKKYTLTSKGIDLSVKIQPIRTEYIPEKQSKHSAGFDIKACLETPVVLAPGDRRLISGGFSLEIPPGFEGQIRPRSGLALKHGITVLNAPGTIDADYRGPVGVILYNAGREPYTVNPGERVGQIVFAPVAAVSFSPSEAMSRTERGTGGFGSTGV
jgi:dUTP pyrophosphatase